MSPVIGHDLTSYEPSDRAIRAAREQLQIWGYQLSGDAVRRLLKQVLEIEGPRIREEATRSAQAALQALEQAHQKAVEQLVRYEREGAPGGPGLARPEAPPEPGPTPPERGAEGETPAEIIRQRLGPVAASEPEDSHPHPRRRGFLGLGRRWGRMRDPEEGELFLFSQEGAKVVPPPEDEPEEPVRRPFQRRPR